MISTDEITYVDAPWLDVARGFLELVQGSIITPTMQPLLPQRRNDIAIMTLA